MRVRRANEHGVQAARGLDVVGVPPGAGDQSRVLAPPHHPAQRRAHRHGAKYMPRLILELE
jgi:hypothetical protein